LRAIETLPKGPIVVNRKDPSKVRVNGTIEVPVNGAIVPFANRASMPTAKFTSEGPAPRKSSYFKFEISNLKFEIVPLCLCISAAIFLSACGYHVGGTASLMPPGLKAIAVPALKNDTPRYRIEQRMTEAVVHEFIVRTKYRIVSSEDSADAVLHGEIISFEAIPAIFDTTPPPTSSPTTVPAGNTTSARATTMLISVHMKVSLEERETKKVLYKNDNYSFREPYEISTDPSKFFDEQGPALERMSRDFAARLVSDVLENF
jgi:Lipopolysaccharide-assembly